MLQELLEVEIMYGGCCDRAVPEEALVRHFGADVLACALRSGDVRICSTPCGAGQRCCWLTDQGRLKANSKTFGGYH